MHDVEIKSFNDLMNWFRKEIELYKNLTLAKKSI
jgi:hypothetical protein